MSTDGEGFEQQTSGGAWQGEKRRKRSARFQVTSKIKKDRITIGAVVVEILISVLALALFLSGFLLVTSYLASAVGEGILLLLLSILLAICAPLVPALWASRPMDGRRAYNWAVGVFTAPFVLAILGLGLALPRRTAHVLRSHGTWPLKLAGAEDRPIGLKWKQMMSRISSVLHSVPIQEEEKHPVEVETKETAPARRITRAQKRWKRLKQADSVSDEGFKPRFRVRFKRKAQSIILQGSVGKSRKPATFLLDPTAPFTAISPEAAARMQIIVPEKAPMVHIETATGPARFPAVVLTELMVGSVKVRNLTALICGPCTHEGLSGVLGANFSSHFLLAVDEKRSRLGMTPRSEAVNRAADIEPFLRFSLEKAVEQNGRIELVGSVLNEGPRDIRMLHIQAVLLTDKEKIVGRLNARIGALARKKRAPFRISKETKGCVESFWLEAKHGLW